MSKTWKDTRDYKEAVSALKSKKKYITREERILRQRQKQDSLMEKFSENGFA